MKKKGINIFLLILMSIITTFAFTYNNNIAFVRTLDYKNLFHTGQATLLILGVFFFIIYNYYYSKVKKNKKNFIIIASLLSIFMLLGSSFESAGSTKVIFGNFVAFLTSLVALIGYFIFFYIVINIIYNFLSNRDIKFKETKNDIIKKIFEKHSFILPLIIILICWLPYIISYYPTIMSPDPSNQIKSYFGIPTRYLVDRELVSENILITNDNPVLHTFLLGFNMSIGKSLFNSYNVGLFFYSIIQVLILSSSLAFTIHYMKKIKVPYFLRIIVLSIYALVPVFPFYSMSCVKDVIFSALVLFYTIILFDLIRNRNKNKIYSIKNVVLIILLCFFITLTRNNGVYLIVLSLPFLFLVEKKNRMMLGLINICPIILYLVFVNIALPFFKITPGNSREMLSVFFQQTARYVKYNKDNISYDEKKAIDKVLTFDTLPERYNPNLADPVKNGFNAKATDEEVRDYFKVWTIGLLKKPGIYVEATMHNTYGYFYPNTANWYIYQKQSKRLDDAPEFDYHYNKSTLGARKVLSAWGLSYPFIPGIGMLVNIGFCTWIIFLLMSFVNKMKKREYLVIFTPALSLLLTIVAGPANTYFRYTLPYIFAIPFLVVFIIHLFNEEKVEKKEKL